MGVFVTTLWQSAMALLTLGFLLTEKMPNPLYVSSGPNRGLGRSKLAGGVKREVEEEEKAESENRNAETAPVRHERPKRFIYGKKR